MPRQAIAGIAYATIACICRFLGRVLGAGAGHRRAPASRALWHAYCSLASVI
jgi:hypothetical protein